MTAEPVTHFAHIAILVSDLEASGTFYSKALGMKFHHGVTGGEMWGKLVELENFKYRADFYERDGVMIELFQIESPPCFGSRERRPFNELGLMHVSFVVHDLPEVLRRVEVYGGRVYPETLVESSYGEILFCTDPDGTRIEIWRKASPSKGS